MTVTPHDGPHKARTTNMVRAVLFGSAAIGSVSGVVIPGWWIDSVYGETTAIMSLTFGLLAVALIGTVTAAGLSGRLRRGAALIVLDAFVVIVGFFTTFFFFGPSAAVAVWLILAGLVLWPDLRSVRRRVVAAGCIVLVVSTVASSGVLGHVEDPPTVLARLFNACCVLYLGYLAGASVKADKRRSARPAA
jgi:hypothetical protein